MLSTWTNHKIAFSDCENGDFDNKKRFFDTKPLVFAIYVQEKAPATAGAFSLWVRKLFFQRDFAAPEITSRRVFGNLIFFAFLPSLAPMSFRLNLVVFSAFFLAVCSHFDTRYHYTRACEARAKIS